MVNQVAMFVDVVAKRHYKKTKTTTDKEGNVVVNQVENRRVGKLAMVGIVRPRNVICKSKHERESRC